jgi:O-antigen ligase
MKEISTTSAQRPGFAKNAHSAKAKERLGFGIIVLLFFLFLEYVRPVSPMGMPLLISLGLFAWWIGKKEKIWAPQIVCMHLLLIAVALKGPFAINTYDTWDGFKAMFAMIASIAVPMAHLANSLRKIRILIFALIVLHVYIAGYAILHNGFGPGGHVGDENDVALSINTVFPMAYCLLLVAPNVRARLFYVAAVVVLVIGVIATDSRGGFVGLLAVIGYCFAFSPNKKLGLVIGVVLLSVGLALVPDSYWAEMATISEEAESGEGTGAHRLQLWGIAFNMFLANPLLGVGIYNFNYNAGIYMSDELIAEVGRSYAGTAAHSVYFTILAETGLAGTLLVAAIGWTSIKSVRRLLLRVKSVETLEDLDAKTRAELVQLKALAYGLRGGMLGYAVTGIFLAAFVYPHFWYVVALIIALEITTGKIVSNIEKARAQAPSEGPRSVRKPAA